MTISTSAIQGTLDGIIKYLNPFSSLIGCHMVNYLTHDHWKAFVPQDIQDEIQTRDNIEEAIDMFWNDVGNGRNVTKLSNFLQFLDEGKKFTFDHLTNTWADSTQIRDILSSVGCSVDKDSCFKIKEFMSEKKKHEVEETAKLISILCTFRKQDDGRLSIIEAGDGKGYLSSRLALEYKVKVLGIDANSANSENALKRNAKLQKAWNGLTLRAEDIENGIVPPRKGRRQNDSNNHIEAVNASYKTTTHYITPQTDFIELFSQYFPQENPSGFCLSGLHTCGNLAPSCLKIFVENKNIDVLCNVGCCYHLMGEEFCEDEFFDNRKVQAMTTDCGFPMSSYLKDLKFSLGRNARMLASQSIHRTKFEKDLPQSSLFYRALLETLIAKTYPNYENSIKVGRSKNTKDFVDYVRNVRSKTEMNFDLISDEELINLEKSFEEQRHKINLFYLLRMTFAPVIETLILLDRLLYLRESKISNSFLVKLFDPIVSPRCFSVIAVKP